MNLQLTEDQSMLQDSLARVLREHSTGARIRAAEPLGFDRALWALLVEQEIPMLRVPEAQGGGGMSLMHAVVVAEQAGRHLASAPIVESIVANRLLSQFQGESAALLRQCQAGEKIVTLALADAGAEPLQVVPAGAIADAVLCLEGDAVTLRSGFAVESGETHGSVPSAEIDLSRATHRTAVNAPGARDAFLAALEECKLLTAAMSAAAARRALEMAAEYACERVAFGRRIGEYQGVAHPLADSLADVEGALLLVWNAVDAIARGLPVAAARVSMAQWWAAVASTTATLRAMRVFGGYGMTMEYDAQLYFRRANAWSLAAGDPERALLAAADRLWGGAGAPLPEAGDIGITFAYSPDAEAAAQRALDFCRRHDTPPLREFMRVSSDGFDLDLHRALAREGLLYPDGPKEFGGGGLGSEAAAAIHEVQGDFRWNLLAVGTTDIVSKIIYHFGTDEARREILPGLMSGEKYCGLGYTEPSGGSDIFAARTTATRDGDDWVVNGQKMFTSTGHVADYNLMILRTGPDKYKGVTLFAVPVRQPGYQITEIKTVSDERTNVSFYSDVRVPDKYRLGEVNGGVKVMALALKIEQAGGDLYIWSTKDLLEHALLWARTARNGRVPYEDPRIRILLAETATRLAVSEVLQARGVWAFAADKMQKYQGPMIKLFSSETLLQCGEKWLRAAAPDTLVRGPRGAGMIEKWARRAIPGTIYAGTSEVQRSIVAEDGLGLPRSRSK
ncbi:MAG: acyl-CoA dehydrogenase family protein [Gammaproteobacteria bacterium]